MSKINLSHGAGGDAARRLILETILPKLKNPILEKLDDSAVFEIDNTRFAFSTDSYVINPIFFPGGDIGKLAVCGTVNDLVVSGAKPEYLSLSFILEEGFKIDNFHKILKSISKCCKDIPVKIITGDIKVVERSKADGMFINTTGIGSSYPEFNLDRSKIYSGDKIIINGTIGDHEIAILSARDELDLQTDLKSDCASLNIIIDKLRKFGNKIKFMRDPTRGGIGCVLNEIVYDSDLSIILDETKLPLKQEVEQVSELLGLDVLYLANEGKVLLFVEADVAKEVLQVLKQNPLGKESNIIGEVTEYKEARVMLKTKIGGLRVVNFPTGSQLPRIC